MSEQKYLPTAAKRHFSESQIFFVVISRAFSSALFLAALSTAKRIINTRQMTTSITNTPMKIARHLWLFLVMNLGFSSLSELSGSIIFGKEFKNDLDSN